MKRFLLIVLLLPLSIFSQVETQKKLPDPYATKPVSNYSNVIGWEDGQTPKAPAGFNVTKYADGFQNPRWMYVTPNGDVLVAESNSNYSILKQIGATIIGAGGSNNLAKSADVITLLRDTDNDGMPDLRQTLLTKEDGLNQPFGMLVIDNWLYVANTDAILRYPYVPGQTKISAKGKKIADLPAGKVNQHWTRNILANADNSKIYIAVGSGDNIGEKGMEHELLKANILVMDPDGSGLKVYATGLRNPVGMDWEPTTQILWTTVNERDGLGDNLVPDYLTSVQEGGFYGWPYMYWGNHLDPRVPIPPNIKLQQPIVPEVDLGSHTASLGLLFYTADAFPQKYRNGAFVVQHGSWNRDILSGYKVVYVPFKNGEPAGKPEDFLTGFIVDPQKDEVRGRPVGAALLPDGSMLITDDTTNHIWRIAYTAE
ncbi:MAG: L-sorbosone dehydrogenase [Aequorivita sp.]|nr:L-sorbosone dehydrogenase [Aequorivita sp.]MDX1782962.1 sorbosone dehydrogenase family protein [Aequorivita vladivostokensis]MAO47758.1 L-sorbosone dehydrogenase [Aequorivita sp.]MBF29895.1 L-sorbosone dehydrogenase [Aequorivita sp.]HAV54093.1 L-sorbosone dehydrogenase [Aequorivita sp.]|tara:strand:- start:82075 stop:83355 length:1281 start_codon:yes stop_codon:yes gene_type:complete